MAEKSGFFNGKLETDNYGYPKLHEDGSQMYDREYTAAEFADMFSLYLTSGIRNGGTCLKVIAAGGLLVQVMAGDAMINGYYYRLMDSGKVLQLNKNTVLSTRTDRIVLRLDLRQDIGRKITVEVKEGDTSLVRTNEIWELCLGDIGVPLNWDSITDAQITDTRLNSSLCGLINSRVEVDTTLLLNQIDEYFRQKQSEWNGTTAGYNDWYNKIMTDWKGWFNQIRVELFSQTNTIFDDWSRHSGYKKEIEFLNNASGVCYRIDEKLYNAINGAVQATRVTEFPTNQIKETLWYSNPSLTVTRTTRFEGDKIIEEVM